MPTVRAILVALSPVDDAKAIMLAELRRRGGSLDRLEPSPWAHAITAAEDALELTRGEKAATARATLRPMRRELENLLT